MPCIYHAAIFPTNFVPRGYAIENISIYAYYNLFDSNTPLIVEPSVGPKYRNLSLSVIMTLILKNYPR